MSSKDPKPPEILASPNYLKDLGQPDSPYERTRLNAYRHGLTGQIMVLLPEEQSAYQTHCAAIKAAYKPVGAIEDNLVQSICDSQWRLKRAVSFENSMFAMNSESAGAPKTGNPEVDVAFSQARTFINRAKNFSLLSTYEGRIHRRMNRDIASLETAQAKRLAEYNEAMKVAKQLYLLALAQGKPYKPEDYFRIAPVEPESVFSPALVAAELTRDALKKAAEDHAAAPKTRLTAVPVNEKEAA